MSYLKSIAVKLFILLSVGLLFLATQFTNPNANETGYSNTTANPVPDSQFTIGAFANGIDLGYTYQGALKLNTWHQYTGPLAGWLGIDSDYYNANTSSYGPLVSAKINNNFNIAGMRTLSDRPIIEYLVSGQRIDYQCEQIDSGFAADPYWFYAYNNSVIVNNNTNYQISDVNDTQYGNNSKVKYCHKINNGGTNQPLENDVLINSGLRANRELAFIQTNDWMKDDAYEWYVMPRIRIDTTFASDANNDTATVCNIVLYGYNDSIVKEIPLRVKNFKDNINNSYVYDGNYKEMYNFTLGQTKLEIDTAEIRHHFIHPGGNPFDWDLTNNTDIEVYWSGKCDMWIDRVRLENRPAHEYLTLKNSEWIEKVDAETGWASQNFDPSNPKPNYIYFEECQMSHFPAIKELNRQITTNSGGKTELVVWLNYDLFKAHVPNCWNYQFNANMLKTYLYDSSGLRTIVMGSYALEGWHDTDRVDACRRSFHPSTLTNSIYDKEHGILSNFKSPTEYDTWLQEHFDDPVNLSGVNYSYISKLMYELSKQGMRIINCPQAHLWHSKGHKLKEPSNEELELQTCLGITYNAKGTMYFAYTSSYNTHETFINCVI